MSREASNDLFRKLLERATDAPERKRPQVNPLNAVRSSSELTRIIRLPSRTLDLDRAARTAELFTGALRTPRGTWKLKPIQAAMLEEAHDFGGLLGAVGVGRGKTLVTFLLSEVFGVRRSVLLIPAALKGKTVREFKALSEHWAVARPPTIVPYEIISRDGGVKLLDQLNPELIVADEVHRLKNPKAACTRTVKHRMDKHPATIFVGLSGTVTSRSILEFAHLVFWALGKKNLTPVPLKWRECQDWALALDEKVPDELRMAPGALEELCGDDDALSMEWSVDPLAAARKAFKRRLISTPGVVATTDEMHPASINISCVEPLGANAEIDTAFRQLRDSWETPDGWEISDAVTMWRHEQELACGFYYMWWNHKGFTACLEKHLTNGASTIGTTARKILNDCVRTTEIDTALVLALGPQTFSSRSDERDVSRKGTASPRASTPSSSLGTAARATSAGSVAQGRSGSLSTTITSPAKFEGSSAPRATARSEYWATVLKASPELWPIFKDAISAARPPPWWLEPRQGWSRFVRETLANNRRGLFSEAPVASAAKRGDLGREGSEMHAAWSSVREKFRPNKVAVWVSDAMIEWCAEQLKPGTICWVQHRAFGERLAAVTKVGFFSNEGLDERGRTIESMDGAPVIASIKSNATGRNLQAWHTNLVVCPPTKGSEWEQMLGRTHREGQTADEIDVRVVLACKGQLASFEQALADARFIEDSTGQPQKLLYATGADEVVRGPENVARRRGVRW